MKKRTIKVGDVVKALGIHCDGIWSDVTIADIFKLGGEETFVRVKCEETERSFYCNIDDPELKYD
jgi:hypothetical protein